MTKKIKVVVNNDDVYFEGPCEGYVDEGVLIIRDSAKNEIANFKEWTYWKIIET